MNRRVRTRTHGGVGGREGQLSLPPDQLATPHPLDAARYIRQHNLIFFLDNEIRN